jgi:RNA polymerase sigma factor (sigma-70 family)
MILDEPSEAATMSDTPSADLVERCRGHDDAAAEALFARYAERLVRLARSRLSRSLASRVDAEDVVQSAYRSFFRLAGEGEVVVRQSGDLWRLLVRITLRKVYRSARRHRAECRDVRREQPLGDNDRGAEEAVLDREPTPAAAAALLDELHGLLAPLGPTQRQIVEMRLQGCEAEEIAAAVQRSPRTVRRTLAALGEELQRRLQGDVAAPPEAEEDLLGYGDFVLRQQLGAGGMGKVYRALWRSRGTLVAVKLLRKPLRQSAVASARFREEAAVLARLRHPGIVALHGVGLLPDGGHFLVMDLIEGSDLGRNLASGPVAVEEAVRWVAEAADAIEHAHQRRIVHCDLKPSNLLVDAAGCVRVSDFGLARSLGESATTRGGTAGFLAPEQIDPDWAPISPRTDVHGLGAVLYALLAAAPPFPGEPPSRASLEGGFPAPAALASLRPDLPAVMEALCRRCLAPRPEDRFPSAAALAAALRATGIVDHRGEPGQ